MALAHGAGGEAPLGRPHAAVVGQVVGIDRSGVVLLVLPGARGLGGIMERASVARAGGPEDHRETGLAQGSEAPADPHVPLVLDW